MVGLIRRGVALASGLIYGTPFAKGANIGIDGEVEQTVSRCALRHFRSKLSGRGWLRRFRNGVLSRSNFLEEPLPSHPVKPNKMDSADLQRFRGMLKALMAKHAPKKPAGKHRSAFSKKRREYCRRIYDRICKMRPQRRYKPTIWSQRVKKCTSQNLARLAATCKVQQGLSAQNGIPAAPVRDQIDPPTPPRTSGLSAEPLITIMASENPFKVHLQGGGPDGTHSEEPKKNDRYTIGGGSWQALPLAYRKELLKCLPAQYGLRLDIAELVNSSNSLEPLKVILKDLAPSVANKTEEVFNMETEEFSAMETEEFPAMEIDLVAKICFTFYLLALMDHVLAKEDPFKDVTKWAEEKVAGDGFANIDIVSMYRSIGKGETQYTVCKLKESASKLIQALDGKQEGSQFKYEKSLLQLIIKYCEFRDVPLAKLLQEPSRSGPGPGASESVEARKEEGWAVYFEKIFSCLPKNVPQVQTRLVELMSKEPIQWCAEYGHRGLGKGPSGPSTFNAVREDLLSAFWLITFVQSQSKHLTEAGLRNYVPVLFKLEQYRRNLGAIFYGRSNTRRHIDFLKKYGQIENEDQQNAFRILSKHISDSPFLFPEFFDLSDEMRKASQEYFSSSREEIKEALNTLKDVTTCAKGKRWHWLDAKSYLDYALFLMDDSGKAHTLREKVKNTRTTKQ